MGHACVRLAGELSPATQSRPAMASSSSSPLRRRRPSEPLARSAPRSHIIPASRGWRPGFHTRRNFLFVSAVGVHNNGGTHPRRASHAGRHRTTGGVKGKKRNQRVNKLFGPCLALPRGYLRRTKPLTMVPVMLYAACIVGADTPCLIPWTGSSAKRSVQTLSWRLAPSISPAGNYNPAACRVRDLVSNSDSLDVASSSSRQE